MSTLDRGSGTLDISLMRAAFMAAVSRAAIALRDNAPDSEFQAHCAVAREAGDVFVRELGRYLDTYERVRTEFGPHGVTPSN